MDCLKYPIDGGYILKKKKQIKKELLAQSDGFLKKKVAILGGSTTSNVRLAMELFLLDQKILPEFYESEYNQFYEDAMFENPKLEAFAPDIIYIHTSNRNIAAYPLMSDSAEAIGLMLENEIQKYKGIWDRLAQVYHCPVIQNNFEYSGYRLLGNKEASDIHGKIHYINRLNLAFYEYAQTHESFYINDINYLSACYGLDRWLDSFSWHMYKYCCAVEAIPELAFNVVRIMKSVFGRNKKGLVLDLDNTLWGGVVGDDGADNLNIGQETSMGQAYSEFQSYIKEQKQLGVILNVNSKNAMENALAGIRHPEGILKEDDFIVIKANWEPKHQNFLEIAKELDLLPESLVFVDDNPAERAIVSEQLPDVEAPCMGEVENYIRVLDRMGYFEATTISEDDQKRSSMYQENVARRRQQAKYATYGEYLQSLEMKAVVKPFEAVYLARIAQLTNKSNQFNLTTRRYTQGEIEQVSKDPQYLTLYGKLADKFGDNGVVSVVIGRIEDRELYLDLWIMSCRVLKRDMEYAMMDVLAEKCQKAGIRVLHGFYYPTAKNSMVKDFYKLQGFEKVSENEQGDCEWRLDITDSYQRKNTVIKVET